LSDVDARAGSTIDAGDHGAELGDRASTEDPTTEVTPTEGTSTESTLTDSSATDTEDPPTSGTTGSDL
jgi:hypothetical protein